MKLRNPNWLSVYVQEHSKTPPVPLNRVVTEIVKECNIVKIKMRQDPASATSNTYGLKMSTFETGKPEE